MALMGVTLKEADAARVRAGIPVLDTAAVDNAERLEPGRPVRLLDPKGTPLAVAVADTENGALRVWSFEPVAALDKAFLRRRVKTAANLRRQCGLWEPDHAFRLINGEGDGLGGLAVDVYGPFAVLYSYAKGLLHLARETATVLMEECGLRGVVIKERTKGSSKAGVKQEVVGEEPPQAMVVKELGVPFEVHLLGGLNVGLFTDMREQRRTFHRFVKDKRVLNTFCYTGAISVAAARGGAKTVTSVDLSSGVLRWAMENFRLSGFNPEDECWRFETSDVVRFVTRQKTSGGRYDVVVLDPPTYSAARTHAWSMRQDYPDLIAASMELTPSDTGGVLWVSANAHGGPGVLRHVEAAQQKTSRRCVVLETSGLPMDYPTPLAWPEGRYLDICYVHVLPE